MSLSTRSPLTFRLLFFALLAPLLSFTAWAANSGAERALQEGRVQEAVQTLQARGHTLLPEDHLLLCRSYFAEDHFDDALAECQAASEAAPTSTAFVWLGRVYGAKASHTNPISAFVLARKVKSSFARAVEIDPNDTIAVGDLGRYYVEAPAVVGGGLDQARTLAASIAARSPETQHHLLGLAAQKAGDSVGAEREFRAAIASADATTAPAAWIDLATCLQQTKQPEKALEALRSAIRIDRKHSASLVDAAGLLATLGVEPELAIQCLREYLSGEELSESAPAFKVHLQLADLLATRGEKAAAQKERAEARALAPGFGNANGSGVSTAQRVR